MFGLDSAPNAIGQAAGGRWRAADGTQAFAVAHCSRLGLLSRALQQQQQQQGWRRIGEANAAAAGAGQARAG